MNIAVFGGTGTTGLLLVEKALAAGHRVTVYARNPSKLPMRHENLHVVKGELTEQEKLARAIQGADAVISLLGPMNTSKKLHMSNGLRTIIAAMEKLGVRRLVAAVSSSYRDAQDRFQFWFDFGVWVMQVLVKDSILKDIEDAGQLVAGCSLDWTMVRLPKLSNQAPKGKFNVGYTGDGKVKNFFLARADLASFLLQQLNDRTYLRQAPVVSN